MNLEAGNLLTFPNLIIYWSIEHHTNLERLVGAIRSKEVQISIVANLCSFKRLAALSILSKAAKSEILITNHRTVLKSCKRLSIVPNVTLILHRIIVGYMACDTPRIEFVRVKSKDLEALRGYLCPCIHISVTCLRHPFVVWRIRVIANNPYLTALCHRLLIPLYLHWSNHCLTRISETARWTVVEDIPLTVYFLQ